MIFRGLQVLVVVLLVQAIHSEETNASPRNRTVPPTRYQRPSHQGNHNSGATQQTGAGNCDTKELVKTLNDRISLLVSLDEHDRNTLDTISKRLEDLDAHNEGRMESLAAQQMDFLKRLDSLEYIQRVTRHTLDELKGETDSVATIRRLRSRKWQRPVEDNQTGVAVGSGGGGGDGDGSSSSSSNGHEMSSNRITRQVSNQTAFNQGNSLDINQKLDSLAVFLTSTRQGIQQLQSDVNRLAQTTTNLQKRFNNVFRRKLNRQPFQGAVLQAGFAPGYSGEPQLVTSCAQDAPKSGGILKVQMNQQSEPFYVLCEADENGADDWTVVLKRFNGVVNFRRDWEEYKAGFGNLAGEFFIGLEKLHALTNSAVHELLVVLEDFNNVTSYARYSHFAIAGEADMYAMNLLGAYEGTAGDSLIYHAGSKFSTFDRDNDGCLECNCAQSRGGGWWYNWCATSNLMGQYYKNANYSDSPDVQNGIFWNLFRPTDISLKKVKMLIRPIDETQGRR